MVEQFGHRPPLNDATGVHHRDIVRQLGHDTQVVRDQQDRHPPFRLDLPQQIEDPRLNRHVDGGGRLVGDEERGVAREGHRDHHPLLHAAGQFVRVLIEAALGIADADGRQGLHDFRIHVSRNGLAMQ